MDTFISGKKKFTSAEKRIRVNDDEQDCNTIIVPKCNAVTYRNLVKKKIRALVYYIIFELAVLLVLYELVANAKRIPSDGPLILFWIWMFLLLIPLVPLTVILKKYSVKKFKMIGIEREEIDEVKAYIYVWAGLVKPKRLVVLSFSKKDVSNCTLDGKSMKVYYPNNQYKEVLLSPFSHEDIQELINLLATKCKIPIKISEQMHTQGYTCPEVPRLQNKRTTANRLSIITEDRNAHSHYRQRVVSDNKETDNGPSLTQHRKRIVENSAMTISLDETDTSQSTTKRKRRLEF